MKPSLYSPTRYIHLLVQFLEQEGTDCGGVLAAFGADRAVLAHPEGQMVPLQALALFRALADLAPRSDIGLRVGRMVTFGSLGDAGRAMLSCATLREALQCWADFHPLIAPSLRLQVHPRAMHTELRWWPLRPMPLDFMKVAYDMAVGALDALMASVLGDSQPGYDAFFTWPAPPHAALYGRLTKARCHFDMPGLPGLRLELGDEALSHAMPLHNPHELAVLRQRLVQRLALNPMAGQWTSWVSMMLAQANGEQPSLEALASIVQVSPGTLTRHLVSEGQNFRALSNAVRHQRACDWLREGQMMVTEIAQRLGYANLPSFVRAFKAMSGVSPTRYAADNALAQAAPRLAAAR